MKGDVFLGFSEQIISGPSYIKNKSYRMHNSELRLHLSCALDNPCLFQTWGVKYICCCNCSYLHVSIIYFSINIYIYITYIHIYIFYVYLYIHIYIFIYSFLLMKFITHIYIYIYVYTYILIYIYIYVCFWLYVFWVPPGLSGPLMSPTNAFLA